MGNPPSFWHGFVLILILYVLWLLWFRRSRTVVMDPEPKAKGLSSGCWVLLCLLFLWLVIELTSISILGTNANQTFQTVPPDTSGRDAGN